jgi:hypothetical protein
MKYIKYELGGNGESSVTCKIAYSDENLEIAKKEAIGEIVIEDDGEPEVYAPTDQERLEALEIAIMELAGVIANG